MTPSRHDGPRAVAWMIVVAAAVAASGCGGSSPVDQAVYPYTAVLSGVVTDSASAPVAGATVLVLSHGGSCSDTDPLSQGVAVTDAQGRLTRELHDLTGESIRCIRLEIDAPTGSALRDTTVSIPSELKLRARPPLDSVAVAITLHGRVE